MILAALNETKMFRQNFWTFTKIKTLESCILHRLRVTQLVNHERTLSRSSYATILELE